MEDRPARSRARPHIAESDTNEGVHPAVHRQANVEGLLMVLFCALEFTKEVGQVAEVSPAESDVRMLGTEHRSTHAQRLLVGLHRLLVVAGSVVVGAQIVELMGDSLMGVTVCLTENGNRLLPEFGSAFELSVSIVKQR